MENFYSITKEEAFNQLRTSESGLSNAEAQLRLKKYGKNVLKQTHKFRPIKIFFQQFNSFLIYILIIAAVISFFIGNMIDPIVISAIVLLNGCIGFFQQYKAEKAIISLKKMIIPKSKVIRGGKMLEIPSEQLVPGDIVILESGDKINADCRIIEVENLQTDEAVLTGESLPINKSTKKLPQKTILTERENMLFTGTQIVRGESKALVVSTGMDTVFGGIAETLQGIETHKTPMQKKLDKFSKKIGIIILVFVGIVMLLGIFERFDAVEMFLTAVALAVSAIPEGLPAVLTLSFSIASVLMSKKNVIIRRLPAVESLGSVTVICSDKTGTITDERMHVKEIFTDNTLYTKRGKEIFLQGKKIDLRANKELVQLIKTSILCNNARFESEGEGYKFFGDPTEKALLSASLDLGFNKKLLTEQEPSLKKFEFDSIRKMMSVVRDNERNKIVYSKGAIGKILDSSNFELVGGQIKQLTEKRKKIILNESKKMEQEALRVLAFAYKNLSSKEAVKEQGLIFLGFAGMIDPPRKEVRGAIKQCQEAGIKVKMITGDSALTAKAIAEQIGIKGKTLVGKELSKLNDEELKAMLDEVAIFARTTPDQKLRITELLQQNNEVVAITGDGINDALALKAADIGIAMGKRGSDVARDVSDMVLIDDNFASIVAGVKQGRKTYDNVKKFIKYFLAVNFSEIFLILVVLILSIMYGGDKWFLPLLPLQILWMNLVTDSFPALALVFEKGEDTMQSSPRKEKGILTGIWKSIILAGLLAFTAEFIIYLIDINQAISPARTQTMVLTTAVLFELFFVYTYRSNKSLMEIGIFSNKWLNYAVVLSIALHLILLYTPLSAMFGVIALSAKDWLLILPFALSGLVIFEISKFLGKKKELKNISDSPNNN